MREYTKKLSTKKQTHKTHIHRNDWVILQMINSRRRRERKKNVTEKKNAVREKQWINCNIMSQHKSNQHSVWEFNSDNQTEHLTNLLPWDIQAGRLHKCESETRGRDPSPSGPAWLSTATTILTSWIRFCVAMSLPASAMGFDKCDSTRVQDFNGDNAKEHLLLQRNGVHISHGVETAIPISISSLLYERYTNSYWINERKQVIHGSEQFFWVLSFKCLLTASVNRRKRADF